MAFIRTSTSSATDSALWTKFGLQGVREEEGGEEGRREGEKEGRGEPRASTIERGETQAQAVGYSGHATRDGGASKVYIEREIIACISINID
jgi:hypothetical protein